MFWITIFSQLGFKSTTLFVIIWWRFWYLEVCVHLQTPSVMVRHLPASAIDSPATIHLDCYSCDVCSCWREQETHRTRDLKGTLIMGGLVKGRYTTIPLPGSQVFVQG